MQPYRCVLTLQAPGAFYLWRYHTWPLSPNNVNAYTVAYQAEGVGRHSLNPGADFWMLAYYSSLHLYGNRAENEQNTLRIQMVL
jgi:hypothetical protein